MNSWELLVLLALPLAAYCLRLNHPFHIVILGIGLFQGATHDFAWAFSVPGWLLLTTIKTVPFALLWWARGSLFSPAFFAALWTLAEWLNGLGPYGHTGGSLSHLLADFPVLLQTVSLFGHLFLTFLLAYLAGVLSVAKRSSLVSAVTLIALLVTFGLLRPPAHSSRTLPVALVQTDVDSAQKFSATDPELQTEELFQNTLDAGGGARLVVWPETAFPSEGLRWNAFWARRLGSLTRSEEFFLVAGSLEPADEAWQNTLHLVGPDGRFLDRYSKQRRVPLVEYLPSEEWRKFPIFQRVGRIAPGEGSGIFECDDVKLGLLLCWESMHSRTARQRVESGAEVLLVVTNDQWFEGTPVPRYHLAMSVFRAVELGRPVVHVSNGGPSAYIDARGLIVAQLPEGEKGTLHCKVGVGGGPTFYSRFGDSPIVLLVIVMIVGHFQQGRQRRARSKDHAQ